jgi:starch synthase (maltosyl-transferring)
MRRERARDPTERSNVTFLDTPNEGLIASVERSEADTLIVCVNLDAQRVNEGLLTIPGSVALPGSFVVQDLLTDETYLCQSGGNYVRLQPGAAHVMHVR